MRKILFFMLAILLMVSSNSCKKDKTDTSGDTSTGFSAKVGGTSWTAKSVIATEYTGPSTIIVAIGSTASETMTLHIGGAANGTYKVTANNNMCEGNIGDYFSTYFSDVPVGQIVITKYDLTNKLVSGTFTFDASSSGSTVYHVTEGKFDNVPLTVF